MKKNNRDNILYFKISILEEMLGCKLAINAWHRHYSIYSTDKSLANIDLIAQSNNKNDLIDQINAAIFALNIKRKLDEKNGKH